MKARTFNHEQGLGVHIDFKSGTMARIGFMKQGKLFRLYRDGCGKMQVCFFRFAVAWIPADALWLYERKESA